MKIGDQPTLRELIQYSKRRPNSKIVFEFVDGQHRYWWANNGMAKEASTTRPEGPCLHLEGFYLLPWGWSNVPQFYDKQVTIFAIRK